MATIIVTISSNQTSTLMRIMIVLVQVLALGLVTVSAFTFSSFYLVSTPSPTTSGSSLFCLKQQFFGEGSDEANSLEGQLLDSNRRLFMITAPSLFALPAAASEEDESFASIAARASNLSREAGDKAITSNMGAADGDTRTAYDFDLPISGEPVRFEQIVRQSVDEQTGLRTSTVKAILVVNMKEDDPIARVNIPEFISLASRYGRSGEFSVVLCPSDQGYYEPDTSQLIRAKLLSEYGFGINPATVVTDKVNFLGKMAHPFWRWLQKNCRTPAGLGRVEGNFEKFLIDGRTGLPLRRYPRRYKPLDISNDIEAIIAGRPLPPAGANFLELWRSAAVEAERDTYRFQKGLNYYD